MLQSIEGKEGGWCLAGDDVAGAGPDGDLSDGADEAVEGVAGEGAALIPAVQELGRRFAEGFQGEDELGGGRHGVLPHGHGDRPRVSLRAPHRHLQKPIAANLSSSEEESLLFLQGNATWAWLHGIRGAAFHPHGEEDDDGGGWRKNDVTRRNELSEKRVTFSRVWPAMPLTTPRG